MSNKIILPFDDKEGSTYELSIDLDVFSKDGILNAIEGIGRTSKKSQRSTSADNDLSRLPEIFDVIARQTDRKNPLFALLSKIFKKKDIEGKMPSPQDGRENLINCGEGHDTYTTKSSRRARGLNPFVPPLNEIEPSAIEDKILDLFKSEVVKTKNVSELKDIVDQALYFGIRINACHEGQQSFADCVMRKILSGQLEGDNQKDKPEDIIRELMLKEAMFSYDLLQDKRISETCNKLRQEVQPQVEKRLKKLEEAGNSAVQGGRVTRAGIDNKTFYLEFSGGTVEPAKILEGTRELGLDKGYAELGGHILKMGNSELEIRVEEGGERNYVDVLDGSNFAVKLCSSLGMLEVRLYHDAENYDQVQIRVENQEMWAELQKRGEVIGKGCLFGGMTAKEAIEKGSFTRRCGVWSKEQATEEIKAVSNNGPSETISWVDKTSKSSKKTLGGRQ